MKIVSLCIMHMHCFISVFNILLNTVCVSSTNRLSSFNTSYVCGYNVHMYTAPIRVTKTVYMIFSFSFLEIEKVFKEIISWLDLRLTWNYCVEYSWMLFHHLKR